MSNFRRIATITPSTASDITGYLPDEIKVRNVGNVDSGTLGIAYGGTGLSTTPTNGQLLIGSGSSYALSTLTAGDNITIVTGSGTIIISASGGGLGLGDITSVTAGTNLTGGGTSGDVTLNLADNISLTSVTASFSGSGANITSITASNITNFTSDVRGQFSAGTGIAINSGVISASNVPNSSLLNSAITLNGQSVSLGGTLTTVAAGTNLTGSTSSGTVTVSLQDSISLTNVTASNFTGSVAKLNYVDFSNLTSSDVPSTEGIVYYDGDNYSLTEITEVGLPINLGRQLTVRARNETGGTLTKGKIVKITGNNGVNPIINTASWDNDSTSANTLGFVMQSITDGQFGYVLLNGVLKGVNTNTFTAGEVIYLSSSGDYTNTIPAVPYHEVRVGQVLDVGSQGSIFVRIQNGYELTELHDVDAASPAYGDFLSWTNTGGYDQWRNTKQLTGSYGLTGSLSATGTISGSSLVGNGSGITSLTASNITNFTTDVRAQFTAGTNITITDGQISSTGGGGGSSGVSAITSSDTNLVFSATTGSVTGSLSANPSFSTVTASSGFSGSGANITAINANNVSAGTLAIARGGTALGTTPTNGQLLIGNGTNYTLGTITGTNLTVTNGVGSITIKGKFCQTVVLDKSSDLTGSNLAATFYIDSANYPSGAKFVIVGNTELTAATGSVSLQRLNGNGNVTGSATVLATLSSSYANSYSYSTGSITTSLYQITYSRTAGSGFVFLPYVHVEAS